MSMFDALCSWTNLLLAYRLAAKGKRGRPAAAAFEYRLEDNLVALQRDLASGIYRPGPYTNFFIHEPKRRLISAAPFRDRVVHHALCNIIEPVFERTFVSGSFANRRGKGTHRALLRAQQLARRHPYVLQCDVQQFFPSVDHLILRDALARKIDDGLVVALIDKILSQRRVHSRARGRLCAVPWRHTVGTHEATRVAHWQFDESVLGQRLHELDRPLCHARTPVLGLRSVRR